MKANLWNQAQKTTDYFTFFARNSSTPTIFLRSSEFCFRYSFAILKLFSSRTSLRLLTTCIYSKNFRLLLCTSTIQIKQPIFQSNRLLPYPSTLFYLQQKFRHQIVVGFGGLLRTASFFSQKRRCPKCPTSHPYAQSLNQSSELPYHGYSRQRTPISSYVFFAHPSHLSR